MAILVTRPYPDNEASAAALRAKGFEVLLAPILRFEPMTFHDDEDACYDGIISTSANALSAIDTHPVRMRLLSLPLFAVGNHTGDVARGLGFHRVMVGKGGAEALPDLIDTYFKREKATQPRTLLYLAGADLAHDLAAEMDKRGFHVVMHVTYRMSPVSHLPDEICRAFAANRIQAVMHYSRRSARAFVTAARAGGVEISALALPQCCISDTVAMIMRDAGAAQVVVARSPDEKSMLDAIDRMFHPMPR